MMSPLTLWYSAPAQHWEQALPIGNGSLGAMIFGGIQNERLQLNEITVWSGGPRPNADRADAHRYLPELRAAIRSEDRQKSDSLAREYMTSAVEYDPSYQTLGDLTFAFDLPAIQPTDYKRSLAIEEAVSSVEFSLGSTNYRREYFSSAPASLIAIKLSASNPGSISFTMSLSRAESATTLSKANNSLLMVGSTDHDSIKGNLDYEVRATVTTTGGTTATKNSQIIIRDADEVVILLTAGTSYALDYKNNYRGASPTKRVDEITKNHFSTPFEKLLAEHIADYQQWFNRVNFTIGETEPLAIPTDQRLHNYGDGVDDPGFAVLFYQFGRYLLISSSRPNNLLPSNSQGIWGDGFDLPWKCDYKSNINFFMNYWAVETANLSDCHIPLLRLVESLVLPGRKTARAYYNAKGWFYVYTTNAWGWTSPGGNIVYGVWTGASGWACQHLWEHYAFTRDRNFLARVYPILKEAAEFYLEVMISDRDGYLVTSPSTSPENYFTDNDGTTGGVTEGCTVDREIIWDLFTNLISAAELLKVDGDFISTVEAARQKIRPPQIGKSGQIEEWPRDWDNNNIDPHHRHISHLYGLMPGSQITPDGSPNLAAAARVTMEQRGDDGTGWSKAWKISVMARLFDGDHAHKLLSEQLQLVTTTATEYDGGGGTYANLFDAHPPFQIDGNFGALAGITEMLLQSHVRYNDPEHISEDLYVIHLLPALPSAWPTGTISGLRARGGFEIDLTWNEGVLTTAHIRSVGGFRARIRYASKVVSLNFEDCESIILNGELI